MSIQEATRNKWSSILPMFGVNEQYLTKKHTPCPLCGGKDRFRFTDYQGRGGWICNQCRPDAGDGFDLIMEFTGKDFKDVAQELERIAGTVKPVEQKKKNPIPRLNHIQRLCELPRPGDSVSSYLFNRGIDHFPLSIRIAKNIEYFADRSKRFDAMIARISDKDFKRVSYHITYLENGKKAPVETQRQILPPDGTIKGAGVYLSKLSEHICIGEGIETTLSGMKIFNLPGIAALNANMLESIELPEQVKIVTILGDNDDSFTGQASAYKLAKRLHSLGYIVYVKIPDSVGDWNDKLIDRAK